MDPTAPNDNGQKPPDDGSQPSGPIQPGQYVVSGEEGAIPNQTPADLTAQVSPQQPAPLPNIQADLQSTVAAATGTNLAGEPPSFTPPQDPQMSNLNQQPAPNFQAQPDPTPFAPPPGPPPGSNTPAPGGFNPTQPAPEGSSKMGKLKIVIIVVALIILVAIAAGLVWFFILNKSKAPTTAAESLPQVEEPAISSPSPNTGGGFGDIPDSTDQAAPADTTTTDVAPQ